VAFSFDTERVSSKVERTETPASSKSSLSCLMTRRWLLIGPLSRSGGSSGEGQVERGPPRSYHAHRTWATHRFEQFGKKKQLTFVSVSCKRYSTPRKTASLSKWVMRIGIMQEKRDSLHHLRLSVWLRSVLSLYPCLSLFQMSSLHDLISPFLVRRLRQS